VALYVDTGAGAAVGFARGWRMGDPALGDLVSTTNKIEKRSLGLVGSKLCEVGRKSRSYLFLFRNLTPAPPPFSGPDTLGMSAPDSQGGTRKLAGR
jgi:hypothetical protein